MQDATMAGSRFHHGDLKAELLRLAARELESRGQELLSLRDLAAQAGVSSAAPYRHFDNRAALIKALVDDGIDTLFRSYAAAAEAAVAPVDRLRIACRSYLDFAERQPERFRLIFSDDAFFRIADASASKTYLLFEDLVGGVLDRSTTDARRLATLACWSTIHGFAMLRARQRVAGGIAHDLAIEAIIDASVAALRAAPRIIKP